MSATSGGEAASSSKRASDSGATNSSRDDVGANHGATGSVVGGVGETTAIDDRTKPLLWIQLGILGWGIVLAFGVSWYDHLHGGIKLQRPLVVLVCTLLFLGGWKLALRGRKTTPNQ